MEHHHLEELHLCCPSDVSQNKIYSSSEHGNLSCVGGHIGVPLDHKMLENFMVFSRAKIVFYDLENIVI